MILLLLCFVQNCKEGNELKLKVVFYLSPTEVLQAKFPITLKTLVGRETKVEGIVMLSSFYLPSNYIVRKKIYEDVFKMKKSIHFILDELILNSKKDIEKIEEYLIFSNSFFTNTKFSLNDYEKFFMKNFNKITFV